MQQLIKKSRNFLVYNHILSCGEKRQHKLLDPQLTESDINKYFQSESYLVVRFEDAPDKIRFNLPKNWSQKNPKKIKTLFLIPKAGAPEITKTGDFYKMLNDTIKSQIKTYDAIDMYVINPTDTDLGSYFTNKIKDVVEKHKEDEVLVRITVLPFYHFNSNKLNHVSIGKMRILLAHEVTELLEHLCCKKEQLCFDNRDSVTNVWLGAEEGDVIECVNVSESGEEINYLCVH